MTDAPCHDLGGTLRARLPEQTWAQVQPILRRVGITRVARITGLDHIGIPVSVAVRPGGRLLSTSQGKGVTDILADLSAIMESIETWHAENLPPADVVTTAAAIRRAPRTFARDAAPVDVVDTRALPTLRGPLDENRELGWLWGRELFSDHRVLLPRDCFDLNTTDRGREGRGLLFTPVTTGLSSGNTWLEATLHGLYEAIERDAHARFNAVVGEERQRLRVDLTSVQDAVNRALIDRIQAAGLELEIYDMTSSIGVPAFYAYLRQPDAGSRCFVDEGMGAHLRPEIALSRAITESAQSRLAYISGSRDDIYPHVYRQDRLRYEQRIDDRTGLRGRDFAMCARPSGESGAAGGLPTWNDQLRTVLSRLQQAGIGRAYALDLTRDDIGVPVVFIFCPGLRDPFREGDGVGAA